MASDSLRDLLTRRTVGKVLLGGATCGYATTICYPIVRYLASGAEIADEGAQVSEITLGKPDEVIAPGKDGGKNFAFGSRAALLIRKGDEFAAYDATCSHLGCTVAYDAASGKILCPCHGGTYDPATGKNIGGPPPAPLRKLEAVVVDDKLIVRKPTKT
jgi:Rieske Fe-S protein